jgi:hypothetical protein
MIVHVVHEENLSPPCTVIKERRVSHLCWHGGGIRSDGTLITPQTRDPQYGWAFLAAECTSFRLTRVQNMAFKRRVLSTLMS